jgi:hypothetical protein
MTGKFTPSPWTNDGGLVCGLDSRPQFAGTPSLDIFNANEWPEELSDEAMSNASLISAAPDLLSALRCLVDEINELERVYSYRFDIFPSFSTLKYAEETIAKAERRDF